MALVTPQIEEYIKTQSWIRRMFEEAAELKAKFGADNVFDFSLGNPDVPPPESVSSVLKEITRSIDQPLSLGYCPNAGRPDTRAALAKMISKEQDTEVAANHVVVTTGAAGAINTIFRSTLSPGDEIVCFAPYFVEYNFYCSNHGGTLKTVKAKPLSFEIDIEALAKAIGPKTRAMIINSPNNPTGVVYSQEEINAIGTILKEKSLQYGKPIFLISDEPYRFLTYDNVTVPPVMPAYDHTIIVSSFSKSLSMAGERVGFIAVNPAMEGVELLLDGLILSNRILGFVNAPVIGQQIVCKALSSGVDVSIYNERRKAMAQLLDLCCIEYTMPKGAFYFFPKAPNGFTDKEFVDLLMTENIITVPGSGFGYPGYFRMTYCIDKSIIESSRPAWERIKEKLS